MFIIHLCHIFQYSDLVKAAELAFQEKNVRALEDLLVKAGKRQELVEHIALLKERLEQKIG